MRIGIQTWGSRGDILPFFALAEGLQAEGHEVTVAYTSVDNQDYCPIAQKGGFKSFKVFEKFGTNMDQAMATIIETNDPLKQFVVVMNQFFDPAVADMYKASIRLCAENKVVIGHMMNHTLLTAAEKFKRPRVVVALAPLAIRTKLIPLFGPNLGSFFNQLTWDIGDYVGRKKLFSLAGEIRSSESLPPIKSLQKELYISKDLTLIASSPSMTIWQNDWEDNIQICGELNSKSYDQDMVIPEDLQKFLTSGTPPIYMTFGSLASYAAEQTTQMMLEAAALSGCRAIIQANWDQVDNTTESKSIFKCSSLPHADVFPYCAAIVHHGSAGTSHTALRSGCPSIVVEHAFDQTFWGNELRRIGVSGKLLHRRDLKASQLSEAIKTTLNTPMMKKKAMNMSEQLRSENGVQKAVNIISNKFENNVTSQ